MAGLDDRAYWVEILTRITEPVLTALSQRQLKIVMPVEGKSRARTQFTHLEALGRTLTGIAPWLENILPPSPEETLGRRYAEMARSAIDAATDPQSPDYMNFTQGGQPIVDTAFLAHAILRAPHELWEKLDDRVKSNLARALLQTREGRKPAFSNWLLFSAMIETCLYKMGVPWDHMRVDYAVRQHEQWYKGDGVYGDGPDFHWDYYNSYVIQPMLVDVILAVGSKYKEWEQLQEPIIARAQRYAAILEAFISPEGTYPAIGRSITYRMGAFQILAQIALMHRLPAHLKPAQVRCALTAMMQRTMNAPGTFDSEGWLTVGLCGHQPALGESYISTGSLYLCTAGLLPLGLPPDDEFWSGPALPWTNLQVWRGDNTDAGYPRR